MSQNIIEKFLKLRLLCYRSASFIGYNDLLSLNIKSMFSIIRCVRLL